MTEEERVFSETAKQWLTEGMEAFFEDKEAGPLGAWRKKFPLLCMDTFECAFFMEGYKYARKMGTN